MDFSTPDPPEFTSLQCTVMRRKRLTLLTYLSFSLVSLALLSTPSVRPVALPGPVVLLVLTGISGADTGAPGCPVTPLTLGY